MAVVRQFGFGFNGLWWFLLLSENIQTDLKDLFGVGKIIPNSLAMSWESVLLFWKWIYSPQTNGTRTLWSWSKMGRARPPQKNNRYFWWVQITPPDFTIIAPETIHPIGHWFRLKAALWFFEMDPWRVGGVEVCDFFPPRMPVTTRMTWHFEVWGFRTKPSFVTVTYCLLGGGCRSNV